MALDLRAGRGGGTERGGHVLQRVKLAQGFEEHEDEGIPALKHLGIGLRGEYSNYRLQARIPAPKPLPEAYTVAGRSLDMHAREILDIRSICEGLSAAGDDEHAVRDTYPVSPVDEWERVEIALFVKDKEAMVRGCVEAEEARAWLRVEAAIHSNGASCVGRMWCDLHIMERRARSQIEADRAAWEEATRDTVEEILMMELSAVAHAAGEMSPRTRQRTEDELMAQTQLERGLRQTITQLRAQNEELTRCVGGADLKENRHLRERLRAAEATIVELREEVRLLRLHARPHLTPSPSQASSRVGSLSPDHVAGAIRPPRLS